MARIGVDEMAFRKGHRYLTIVNDVDRGTVEFVAEGREKASLAAFYESRTPEQFSRIQAVAMDMWEPYIQSTLDAVPLASSKIVFDRFHVMLHVTKAVNVVRRRENQLLLTEHDDRLKARSTCGSPPRRTSFPDDRPSSASSGEVISRLPVPGQSRRSCGICGRFA